MARRNSAILRSGAGYLREQNAEGAEGTGRAADGYRGRALPAGACGIGLGRGGLARGRAEPGGLREGVCVGSGGRAGQGGRRERASRWPAREECALSRLQPEVEARAPLNGDDQQAREEKGREHHPPRHLQRRDQDEHRRAVSDDQKRPAHARLAAVLAAVARNRRRRPPRRSPRRLSGDRRRRGR